MTGQLLLRDFRGPKRKGRRRIVAGLRFERGVIDSAAVEARAGAGLEPADTKAQRRETVAQAHRGEIAGAAGVIVARSDVHQSLEEGACGQNHLRCFEDFAELRLDAAYRTVVDDEPFDAGLTDMEVGCRLKHTLHPGAIGGLVGLRAACSDGGTLACVEEAELDPGLVDRHAHLAAECVDLAHQVALADTADSGIAGHLADVVEVQGEHERARAHPRGGESGFDTGMAGANHDNFVGHREGLLRAAARAQRAARQERGRTDDDKQAAAKSATLHDSTLCRD